MQTWCFGEDLAMVFLGGEVVVDYSIRLNEMLDGDRLWTNAYSNDVPCYIASKRILREGGDSTEARLEFAFRQAISRPPDDRETDLLGKFLASSRKRYEANPKAAGELVSTGQAPRAEGLDDVELAAWTNVARAILNLNQTITRN